MSVSLYSNLNRRHKAIILIVLIVSGVSLISGASLGNGLGLILLGTAFAWTVGSDYRPVHVALLLIGIVTALGGPILSGWTDHQSAILSYQFAVTRYSEEWLSFMSDKEAELKRHEQEIQRPAHEKNSPEIYDLSAGLVPPAAPKVPPPFSLRAAISDHWRLIVPGLLVTCLGLGLIIGVKSKYHLDRGQS